MSEDDTQRKFIRPFKRKIIRLVEVPPIPKVELHGNETEFLKAMENYAEAIKKRNEQLKKIRTLENEITLGREQMRIIRPSVIDKLLKRNKSALEQSRRKE